MRPTVLADPNSDSRAIAVVNRLYAAFVRRDSDGILAELGNELDWNEAESFMLSDRNPYRTPVEVANGVGRRLATEIRDYKAAPSEIFDAGNVVIAIGRSSGTFVTTGRAFDAQYAHVWRVRNGKIVGFQQYIDTLEVARAAPSNQAGGGVYMPRANGNLTGILTHPRTFAAA